MYSSFVHYIYIYIITGKSGGVVRIINRRTAERALLKDFIGRVIDIAFAHTDDILIGAVDEIGNLMVYHVKETDDMKLMYPLTSDVISYGSWIYNYLCNQCLSPMMLWVRISIRVRSTTLSDKVCQ